MKLDDIIQQPGQMERMQQETVLSRINVARPGLVMKYDEDEMTVDVQLAVRGLGEDELPPVLKGVPVVFIGSFTFNVQRGDECLVVFADGNADAWWQTGNVANPLTGRKHDLSDGFALVGVHSKPNTTGWTKLEDVVGDISQKADKVTGATEGDLAGLDATGNLTDSGKKASDFADRVSGATSGNFAGLDASGNLTDSGNKASDFTYSAGSGLALSNNTFRVDVPRVAESANHLPGNNSWVLREYTSGANYNLPSNAWYHIYEAKGSDAQYGTQLALGMTTDAAYYRRYSSDAWQSWKSLVLDDTKVLKAGDTMTGNLTFNGSAGVQYEGTKATYKMIKFIDNTSDTYGNGISIGGGGLAIIGGGEAADTIASGKSGGDETLYLGSDGNVYVYTNCQSGMSSAKTFTFGSNGTLTAPAFSGPLTGNVTGNCSGSSGSCTGNAATATNASALYVRSGSLVKGTNPSSTVWPGPSSFLYEKGSGTAVSNRIGGGIETSIQADGLTTLNLRAYQYASGSSNTNSLEIRIAKDGTCTYAVTSPANFRSAISAPSTAQLAYTTGSATATDRLVSASSYNAWYKQRCGDKYIVNMYFSITRGTNICTASNNVLTGFPAPLHQLVFAAYKSGDSTKPYFFVLETSGALRGMDSLASSANFMGTLTYISSS